LAAQPVLFTDVVNTSPFGAISTNTVNSDTTIEISLNASALAAISSAQGGHLFLGGVDSGELNSPNSASAYDFEVSQSTDSILQLVTTSNIPEPTTWPLLGVGTVVLSVLRRRRPLQH
jgi:hypothetical protein